MGMEGKSTSGTRARPSGVVAFLFTDIEGSTALWSDDAAGMGRSLEVHDHVVRSAIESHDGYVFATGGDGFAAAFSRVTDAVSAATAAQASLHATAWPGPALKVRMGLHVGETQEREGDYFGQAVALAARAMAAGHGGQVLASQASVASVPVGPLHELGTYQLAGIPHDVEIVQLGDATFPPLRTRSTGVVVLPTVRSARIGQEAFLDAVAPQIASGSVLTLTGVGGCGKTRLAVELAGREAHRFPGGVWFVDLSAVAEPDGLEGAVAAALSLFPVPGIDVADQIGSYLEDRTALVVMDNCEHLLDEAAALIEGLLDSAPELAVLATSREQLEMDGEHAVRVPSLDVGAGSAGVALFLDRATAAGAPGPLEDELDDIIEICEALDGIPLAIELAATRMRSMTAPELRAGLDDRFRLLGGRRRGRQRQQTLESTVRWSYDLCTPDEQQMLRHLSVFQGGFDIADAAVVAGVSAPRAVQFVDSLVAKSLVDVIRTPGGARRRLLETIRLFALGQLIDGGEAETARDRHLDRFVDEPMLTSFAANCSLAGRLRLGRELLNLRAAATWAIERDRPADAAIIAAGVMDQMANRGETPLALHWLSVEPADVTAAVMGRAAEGHLRYFSFDIAGVDATVDRAIELADGQPVDALPWVLASNRSLVRLARGEVDSILDGIEEAREIAARTPSGDRAVGFVEFVESLYGLGLLEPERCIEKAELVRSRYPELADGFLGDASRVAALLSLDRDDEAARAVRAIRPAPPWSPYTHVPTIVEILVSATEIGPDAAAHALAAAAPEAIARQPLTSGDWIIGFAWLACQRGDLARARELLVDTKHHSFPFVDVWRRAFGWPGDGRAAFARWMVENPWSELVGRAIEAHPRLIAEELVRWSEHA